MLQDKESLVPRGIVTHVLANQLVHVVELIVKETGRAIKVKINEFVLVNKYE